MSLRFYSSPLVGEGREGGLIICNSLSAGIAEIPQERIKETLFSPSPYPRPQGAGNTILVVISFICFLFLPACQVKPPKPPLVQTVAVLLFDNESNDVNASDIMQRLCYLALKPSVYQVMDLDAVNKKLKDSGIVDGGQLPAADPVKLGKDMGVQGLLYGNVESFNYVNVGFYVQRKVVLELKLVDVGTGQTLWENSGTGSTRKINLDSKEAGKALAAGLADQLADKLFDTPLEEEARIATIRALAGLPGYVFTSFAKDDKTPSGAKREGKKVLKNLINKK